MAFDYNKEEKTPMSLVLENGISIEGEFIDLKIAPDTLPTGKQWYQIRYSDDDDMEVVSLKRGYVIVNFFGTFICDPIKDMEDGEEVEISKWGWDV